MRRILLVEPHYRNKYPPLGLMKLSTYHKLIGDYVQFEKGTNPNFRNQKWDRIYISTLFTFHWKITIKTIKYYYDSVNNSEKIIIGGVMATLLKNEIKKEVDVRVIGGLLNKPAMLDDNNIIIDNLTPDYKMLDDTTYDYGLKDAYLGYSTRGCPNSCNFCAVNKIEEKFIHYLPLKKQVRATEEIYGPKKDLILMDNNVLASENFKDIINDILSLGFEKGAKFEGRLRFVDFNQGLDARLLNEDKMSLLSKTSIRPLRIAFDHINLKDIYTKSIRLAHKYGINNLSNYILYNYTDKPKDFYKRLKINILLNEEVGVKVYSFPMKYIPLKAKDRTFIGKHWNKQLIRGVQSILLATRGMVGTKMGFFQAAFGSNVNEFLKIALMPEEFIIHRKKYENNKALEWRNLYEKLSQKQLESFYDMVKTKKIQKDDVVKASSKRLKKFIMIYIEADELSKIDRKKAKVI